MTQNADPPPDRDNDRAAGRLAPDRMPMEAVVPRERSLWVVQAAAALLLIAAMAIIGALAIRTTETDARVAHAVRVHQAAATLQSHLVEPDAAQRRRLAAQAPGATPPHAAPDGELATAAQRLAALLHDDPGQQARLTAVLPAIDEYRAALLAGAASAGSTQAVPDQAMLRRNAAQIDTIRQQLAALGQAEMDRIAARQIEDAAARRYQLLAATAALLLALLLSAAAVLLHRVRFAALREANACLAGTLDDRDSELRASEQRFLQVFQDSPLGLCLATARTRRIVAANRAFCRMLGYEERELLGRREVEFTHPDQEAAAVPTGPNVTAGTSPAEQRYLTRSGATLVAQISAAPLPIPGEGEPLVLCSAEDVSRGKAIEAALRDSEARMRLAVEAAGLGVWEEDIRRRAIRLDARAAKHIGATLPADVWLDCDGPELTAWTTLIHPEDAAARTAATQSLLDGSGDLANSEFRVRLPDAGWAWVSAVGMVAERESQSGLPLRILTILQDIAARKETEAELRHAQRLEAVGQLTGGVAHDFNNLLGAILGHTEFLLDLLPEQSEERQLASEVLDCALNGAALTQRLLAFARRQPLQPAVIDLNEYLPVHVSLLQRTLGETITIAMVLEPGLWSTHADPSQIADVLLNLAINARDAMPHGGKLTIATANASLDAASCARHHEAVPGDYVVLSVTDTGVGMTPEVLAHAMEPFFTTKPPGKGSGLGLSTIYGFARQTGGHISIDSEPGKGTTVRVYLPRSDGEKGNIVSRLSKLTPLPRGNEAILVVDDNDTMRSTAARNLAALGYRVRLASDGPTALAIIRAGEQFDLLFTDLVMPNGLSGYQLAKAARALQPGLPVLFTTGFASFEQGEEPLTEVDALRKPYRRRELAERVRAELDRLKIPPR